MSDPELTETLSRLRDLCKLKARAAPLGRAFHAIVSVTSEPPVEEGEGHRRTFGP